MRLKKHIPLMFSLLAGALGFCLRTVLYRVGFDEKNILSSSHPLHLCCLGLTLLTAVYLLTALRKLGGSIDPVRNFPRSPLRSFSLFCAGCLLAVHCVSLLPDSRALPELLRTILALSSAFSLILWAFLPARFTTIPGLCPWLCCVFFMLNGLCRYSVWSGNPQLPDYVFQVLACVLLILTSYHRLAFGTGLGRRRKLLFCGLMSIFLCLMCAAGPEAPLFYLSGAFWAAACLCTFQPPADLNGEETE